MPKPYEVILGFTLDKLPLEPVQRRIEIVRALAAVAPTNRDRANLLSLAELLENTERRHRQFVLDFQRRTL